jgi:hypothetical protein
VARVFNPARDGRKEGVMPKEKINHSETVPNMVGGDCRIEVGWTRAQPRVTVSALTTETHYLGQMVEAPGALDSDDVVPPPSEGLLDFHGFGCTLDEEGVTKLIGVLQRAQRHAFAPAAGGAHFRQRNVKVDAIHFTGHNVAEVCAFLDEVSAEYRVHSPRDASTDEIFISQVEHEDRVTADDWVVRRPNGSVVPVGPQTFASLYDSVG